MVDEATLKEALRHADSHIAHHETAEMLRALAAEVRRLREGLTQIRDIEEYVRGRACSCHGVGCVQCVARLALDGREGELVS
jgi:hypothetical protein